MPAGPPTSPDARLAVAAYNESLLPIIEQLHSEFFLGADAAWARLDWDVLSPHEQDFGHSHRSLVRAIAEGREDASRRVMQRHIEEGLTQNQGRHQLSGAEGMTTQLGSGSC